MTKETNKRLGEFVANKTVILLVLIPGIQTQQGFQYDSPEDAKQAIDSGFEEGLFEYTNPNGVYQCFEPSPGTVYTIVPKREYERMINQEKLMTPPK